MVAPAILLLSACSANEPSTSAPETSSNAVASTTSQSIPTSDIVRSNIAEPSTLSSEPVSGDLPGEAQMCRDLLQMMEQFPDADAAARKDSLTKLRAESVASDEWQLKSEEEQASMNRAFDAAIDGECPQ
ncbi:hypothetical protein [Rhodococcus sp. ARP2]|uniref:hypothetical protein n=1 Tax=Rhodococcus sp. ARP2 TaxID=1661385 RepID=UPI0011874D9C|nr:hypothetical protein [Rhodococcus sp. ARP2]